MEKNLGHATAYGYAKSKGYSGTEDEFAELMANYASVGQSAAQSAEQAAASATSASQSADTASVSAQTAQTAQQTATAKASEAQQSATTATTKAQEASQSASESSQSASTAVQAKTDAITAKTASETAQGIAESARDDAETARDEAQQYAESIDPDEFDRKIYAAYVTDIATGAIAFFPDGADDVPMKDVKVQIEPVQDLSHGDPSPDNICPISGWTEANIHVSPTTDAADGTTYNITFPSEAGTVYGGTLDVTTGSLVVDRAMVDLGTLTWDKKTSGVFYSWGLKYLAKAVVASQTANAKCTTLKIGTYDDVYSNARLDNAISVGGGSQLGAHCSAFADNNEFKTAMSGVQFCYELATPITYQLAPTEIRSLLGTNNVFADTGDSAVEYRADTKLYISKKIAEAVSALT